MKNALLLISAATVAGLVYYSFFRPSCTGVADGTVCKSPIAIYEDPGRLPLRTFVLDEIGDLEGKKVIDIGAGPGFFAFEMAKTADEVVATELDAVFLDHMKEKKEMGNHQNFSVVEALDDHSELEGLNADAAVMVFVFHYIEDPKAFLSALKKGLKPGGEVFIANAQMSSVIIADYLRQAGFEGEETAQFSFHHSEDCGPMDVRLIRAHLPADHVQL